MNNYNTVLSTLKSIDWAAVAARLGAAARVTWVAAQLMAMVTVMLAEVAYERRQQIRNGAVMAVAMTVVAAERTFQAGQATRNWLERMGSTTTETLAELPEQIAPVAPIVAPTLAVAKSAAAALSDWLDMGSDTDNEVAEVEEGFGAQLVRTMDDLMALPAATLREMAGTRTRYPKAKLVAMVMAS